MNVLSEHFLLETKEIKNESILIYSSTLRRFPKMTQNSMKTLNSLMKKMSSSSMQVDTQEFSIDQKSSLKQSPWKNLFKSFPRIKLNLDLCGNQSERLIKRTTGMSLIKKLKTSLSCSSLILSLRIWNDFSNLINQYRTRF